MRARFLVAALATFLLVGCPDEAAGPPDIAVSQAALDFGTVSVGEAGTQVLTVSNAGGGTLDLLSLTLTEGSAAIFSVTRDPANQLAAGESIDVTVVFTPNDEGEEERGRIQIRSTDEDTPSLLVPLQGIGGPSVIDGDGDGYTPAEGDCNDNNDTMFPGNPEICDGRDNDCDGSLPANEADADNDGVLVCEDDCDDTNGEVYPGAPEVCDGVDNDCDGVNADFDDIDGDGFTPCEDDCDDAEPDAWPGNVEVCDGIDNDCSGVEDDLDVDGDGHSPCSVGGDCDDEDPLAYPTVVDAAADGGGDGSDATPYRTLADALGDLDAICRTVVVVDGAYSHSGSLSGVDVTIEGQSRDGVVFGPDGGRFLEVTANSDVTLRTLTLDGFSVTGDGGALSATNSTLTLDDVLLANNQSTGDGGAVAVFTGSLVLDGAEFNGNQAGDDGGAVALVSSELTMDGGLFIGNSGARGGAFIAEGSVLAMEDGAFHENTATDDGGALMVIGSPTLELQRLEVFGNTAGLTGGGLAVNNTSDPDGFVRNLAIRDNEVTSGSGTGGGLYVGGTVAAFVLGNNTLTGNTAGDEGAGIHVDANNASGLYAAANIVAYSTGDSGFAVRAGVGGTYVSNTAFGTSAVNADFDGDIAQGVDDNTVTNPQFATFSPNGDPYDDAVGLAAGSPMIDSGPADAAWDDPDGSQNDRGASGGPGAN